MASYLKFSSKCQLSLLWHSIFSTGDWEEAHKRWEKIYLAVLEISTKSLKWIWCHKPVSVWRMAESLDSVKIKSENQGPWREFGACYRLLFPLGSSSKSSMEVCNNPALLITSDYFVCCRRKLSGKEHRQEELQGSEVTRVRAWMESAAPHVSLTWSPRRAGCSRRCWFCQQLEAFV